MSETINSLQEVEDYINDEKANTNEVESKRGCGCGCRQMPEDTEDTNHPHGVTCSRVHTQTADVSLPVRIKPYAKMGTVETRCCGEPAITVRQCGGTQASGGCDLLITQTICCRIPVEYGASATPGEVCITCKRPTEAK